MSLDSLRGRPVLINFWASWCVPCRQEMPELAAAWQAQRASGLEVLAVNLTDQERLKDVETFVAELALPFPVLLDKRGGSASATAWRRCPPPISSIRLASCAVCTPAP